MMVNLRSDGYRTYDLRLIRALYVRKLNLLKRQIRAGKSIRHIARRLRLSHPTVASILRDPQRSVSRKVMLKIIRKTTKKKPKPERTFGKIVGRWAPDAI